MVRWLRLIVKYDKIIQDSKEKGGLVSCTKTVQSQASKNDQSIL